MPVLPLLADDAVRAFADGLLRPLNEHDATGRGDLVASLRAWLSGTVSGTPPPPTWVCTGTPWLSDAARRGDPRTLPRRSRRPHGTLAGAEGDGGGGGVGTPVGSTSAGGRALPPPRGLAGPRAGSSAAGRLSLVAQFPAPSVRGCAPDFRSASFVRLWVGGWVGGWGGAGAGLRPVPRRLGFVRLRGVCARSFWGSRGVAPGGVGRVRAAGRGKRGGHLDRAEAECPAPPLLRPGQTTSRRRSPARGPRTPRTPQPRKGRDST